MFDIGKNIQILLISLFMEEKFFMRDNCIECPRYNAHSKAELKMLHNYGIGQAGLIWWHLMMKSLVGRVRKKHIMR